MAHGEIDDIKHHVKLYIRVFTALMVATIITVAVGYVHLPIGLAVVVALAIATVKASLVAAFFMHLTAEKKIIYASLALAAVFWVFLMALPNLSRLGGIGHETPAFDHVAESVPPAVH